MVHDLEDRIRAYSEHLEDTTPWVGAETAQRIAQRGRRSSRLIPAIAAAGLVVLVIAAVVILDPFGSEEIPFVEESTTAPTTTGVTEAVPSTTTTVLDDTTTSTAVASTTLPAPPLPLVTWTRVFTGEGVPEEIQAVAQVDGGYVAVGNDENADALVLRSTDGINWEQVAADVFRGEGFQGAFDVAASSDVVVVVGDTGSSGDQEPLVWTSTDAGATWRQIELEGTGRAWAVTATEDGFLAAGDGIWTSPDGIEWRPVVDDGGAYGVVGLVHSPRGFVSVGNSDHQAAVWVSEDGETWQRVPHDDGLFGITQPTSGSTWMNDVVATPDGFMAVGVARNKPAVWTSVDGYSWTRTSNQPAAKGGYQPMNAVTRTEGWLVAVGFYQSSTDTQTALAWVSHDNGQTWRTPTDEGSAFTTPRTGTIYPHDVVGDGTQLLAVGYRNDSAAIWIGTIEE